MDIDNSTRIIMEKFNLHVESALELQAYMDDYMAENFVDYPDCSEEEFEIALNQCYEDWRMDMDSLDNPDALTTYEYEGE